MEQVERMSERRRLLALIEAAYDAGWRDGWDAGWMACEGSPGAMERRQRGYVVGGAGPLGPGLADDADGLGVREVGGDE